MQTRATEATIWVAPSWWPWAVEVEKEMDVMDTFLEHALNQLLCEHCLSSLLAVLGKIFEETL